MSNDLSSVKSTVPEGFAKWATTYFAKKGDEPEVPLDLEALFNNAYMRMRESLDLQLQNVIKVPQLKGMFETKLQKCDTKESIPDLQQLVAEINDELKTRRVSVAEKLDKLYDETIFARLDLKRDPNEARDTINTYLKTWDIAEAEREVNLFEEQIKRAKSLHLGDTDSVEKLHGKTKLQNEKYSRNAHQSKAIAMRLIDGDGNLVLDAGVWKTLAMVDGDDISSLMEEIRSGKHKDLPQSEHALAMLKKLQNSEELRNKLTSIVKPVDDKGEASQLIRSTLGLDPEVEITDAHARQAALSGLLFQARQGKVGSCFTTATACLVQRNRPEKFLDDMSNLFATGKLTRSVKHPKTKKDVTIEVPLNRTLLQGNLEKKTAVKRDKSDLHMAPDFVASMDSLQIPADEQKQAFELATLEIRAERALAEALESSVIDDKFLNPPNSREALLDDVIQQLRDNPKTSIRNALESVFNTRGMKFTTVTNKSGAKRGEQRKNSALSKCDSFDDPTGEDSIKPEELIERIVKARVPKDQQEAALLRAREAFLGQQDNLIMRTWEYSIATMVEKMPGEVSYQSMMQGAIAEPSSSLLSSFIKSTSFKDHSKKSLERLKVKLLDEFQSLVESETETRYDPSVKNRKQSSSKDGHSSSGGYSLFFRNEKIVTGDDYTNAMCTLLNEAWNKINDGGLTQFQQDNGPDLVSVLKREFGKASFQEKIVEKVVGFDGKKTSVSDKKLEEEKKNKMTNPWTYEAGGSTVDMLQIYYDSPGPLREVVAPSTVNNAEAIGDFILGTMKTMGLDKKLSSDLGQEQSSIPVRTIGVHAFNLLPNSPGINMLLKGFDDPKVGLREYKRKEVEKNTQRNAYELSLTDPPSGILKSMVDAAVTIFGSSGQVDVAKAINVELQSKGVAEISIADANALIRRIIVDYLLVNYPTIDAPNREIWADTAMTNGVSKSVELVVPRLEYEPIIELCLTKLKVPESSRETIRKGVLESLKDDEAKDRKSVLKVIQDELLKQGVDATQESLESACKVPVGIVIADGNWGDGDHRTLMSLVVSPITGEMELWQMNEDGTEARKMNEKTWVTDHRWGVFLDSSEYGGNLGNQAWENKRGEIQGKLDDCVTRKVGDVLMMQSVLEIADARFNEGKQEQADKALENLEKLTKEALALGNNIDSVFGQLRAIESSILKVPVPAAAIAAKQVKDFASAIRSIRNLGDIDVVLNRHSELCKMLKETDQPLFPPYDVQSNLVPTV